MHQGKKSIKIENGGVNCLESDVADLISDVFSCDKNKIANVSVLKKGMTNRSYLFEVNNDKYLIRIPGEGTDKLIDRKAEYDVYKTISGKGICDDPIYINPDNGYKITKYLKGVRCADPENEEDLIKCMKKLRDFHSLELNVQHRFDLFEQALFYESLRKDIASLYKDYEETKKNAFQLRNFIEKHVEKEVLTHIDAVPDNFLFYVNDEGKEDLQLTDFEYAGMQDPHVDIAMFCIYSLYDRSQIDHLIDIYFEGRCSFQNRIKIYCYIAIAGLLWSNWCEYKLLFGVEFGEYAIRQYQYAKDYYQIARSEMEHIDG